MTKALYQELLVITKNVDGTTKRQWIALVAFVPLTGEGRDGPTMRP